MRFSEEIDSAVEEFMEKATSNIGLHSMLHEMDQDTINAHADAMAHHAGAIQRLRVDPNIAAKLKNIKTEADIDADPDLSRLASHAARYTAHLARLKELDTMQRKGEQHGFVVRLDTPNLGGSDNKFIRHGRLKAANPATGEPAQFRTDAVTKNIHYLGFPEYEAALEKPDHPNFGQPKQEFPFGEVKLNGTPIKPKAFEEAPAEEHPHDSYPGLSLRKKHGGRGTYMGSKTGEAVMRGVMDGLKAKEVKSAMTAPEPVKKSLYFPDVTDEHFFIARRVVEATDPFSDVPTDSLLSSLTKSMSSSESPSTKALYIAGAIQRLESLSKADEESTLKFPKFADIPAELKERKTQPVKTPSGRDDRLPWFKYSGPAHPEGKLTEFDHDEELHHLKNLAAEHGSLATHAQQQKAAAATAEDNPQLAHEEAVKKLRADLAGGNIDHKGFADQWKQLMDQRKQTVVSRVGESQETPEQKKLMEEVEPLTGGTGYKLTTITPIEQKKRQQLSEATDAHLIDPELGSKSMSEAKRSIGGEGGMEEGDIDETGVGTEGAKEEKLLSSEFTKQWLQHRKKALSHVSDDPQTQNYVEHLLEHTATHNPHELPLLVESIRQAHQAHHDDVFNQLKDVAEQYGTRRALGTVLGSKEAQEAGASQAKDLKGRAKDIMSQPDADVVAAGRTEKPKPKVEVRRKGQ